MLRLFWVFRSGTGGISDFKLANLFTDRVEVPFNPTTPSPAPYISDGVIPHDLYSAAGHKLIRNKVCGIGKINGPTVQCPFAISTLLG